MNVTIQNIGGSSLGPFDIYYDNVWTPYLIAANISSASLAAGLNLTIPNTATTLYVVNTRTGCNNVAQAIPVPPPTYPLTYESVTVSARYFANTTLPRTSSVYYMIDTQGYNYLGEITDNNCNVFPSIPVPTNSTLLLGIISGSNTITVS